MTNKELRRLSRTALIDLLIEQTERNNELQARIDKLERQVKNRTFTISSPASMADAAAELNRMLSNAERTSEADTQFSDPAPAPRREQMRAQAPSRSAELPYEQAALSGAGRGAPAGAEKSRPSRAGSSGSRPSGRGEHSKKPESKFPLPRRDERSGRNARRDPAADPFGSAPLDDNLNKAFNEMLKRNSR